MGVKERREREKENLRQAILEAAEALFVAEGFENVSMRKIANKIEYSPTTIYLYFNDKEEIFNCLLEEYFLKIKQVMSSISDENDDLLTNMKKGMRAYIEFGLRHPNYYKLAFLSNPVIKAEAYLAEGMVGTEIFLSLRNKVEKCIRQGLFRELDIDLVTQVIWTMNHGITSLLITNPNFPWVNRDRLINQSIESTVAGFLKAGSRY